MSLDLFDRNIADGDAYAQRNAAPYLPSTFEDNFNDAWSKGYLTGQSISGEIRKTTARQQMVDDAIAKTGDQSFAQSGEGGGFDTAGFNDKVAKHKAARPDLDIQPISDEAVQARADDIGIRQLSDSASFARRERTTGGSVGSFFGTAAASVADPVNLIAFPLAAPEAAGIIATTLAWGAIGAGSQTAIEALNATSMERINPGYGTSGEPVHNILGAGVAGGVLGGGLKGLSMAWSRVRTGSWPRTVRDAGNVIESEAQIANSNPMPGVEGEAAHRTALSKGLDDLANGRPVDVEGIVPDNLAPHIEAWHGSPHDFDRFDISKIGTGEGAQAYGHGLYFAEAEGTAKSYKDTYVPYRTPVDAQKYGLAEADAARISSDFTHFRMNKSAEAIDDEIASRLTHPREGANALALDILQGPKPEGNIYKVKITANKDHMLDWDKPLSEQSPEVQAKLQPLIDAKLAEFQAQRGGGPLLDPANALTPEAYLQTGAMKGQSFYQMLGDGLQKEDASRALADVGIPGVKYSDAFSRGATDGGTRNIVVFNDKHVQITHKNGKPVNAEIRQSVVDQAAGLPPKQPDLGLTPPEPAKPPGPSADAVKALDAELTPVKIEEARVHPDMEETVARDLDKLMLEKPDMEVPTGVTVDADGRTIPTTRKVESIVAEADDRLAAAKEIEACVGPYPAEAA